MHKIKKQDESKIFLEERLKMSNRKLWNNLSDFDRDEIINKYFDLYDVKNVGIRYVIDNNRHTRTNFYILFLGLILGVFGNLIASVVIKYLYISDVVIVFLFVMLLLLFVRYIEKWSAEDLGDNGVLEYLLELVEKDKA